MKKQLSIFILILVTNLVTAQVSKTVNVITPGTLSTMLTATEKTTVTNLTLTGNIDARDVKCIRDEIINLVSLDMTLVTIQTYSGINGTIPSTGNYYTYPSNELPEFSFSKDAVVYNSTLKTINLPNNLNSIGLYAFRNCSGISSLIIPTSVVLISDWVFSGCTSMKTITCLIVNPPDAGMSFGGISLTAVYVPFGSASAYKAVLGWSLFNIVEYVLKVSTQTIGTITLSTAKLNASIDFIAATSVTAHGFCWNTTGSPTITNNITNDGTTTTIGAYSTTLTGLIQGTTYYVKAYATDGERTVYGSEVSFTTPSIPNAAGIITGPGTVCQGQNTVTYTVPTIPFATSYVWTLPTGVTGISTTNSISVNFARTATAGCITVNGHNSWGDGVTSTFPFIVNLLPVNLSSITGSTSICQGENAVTYTVPAIDNATSYTWTIPTGATGTSTTNSITINYSKTAVSGNITVKGHNDCGDGATSTLAVIVNQLPVISATDKTITCGGSVLLNITTNYSGNGTLKYIWTPSTGLNDSTLANPTSTITSDVTYRVIVTTPFGCTTSANVKVTVNPFIINAGVDKTITCGGSTSLNTLTTNYSGTGTLRYKWTPSTGLNNDTISTPTATVIHNTIYTVTVTTPNGCSVSDNIALTILPMDKPEIGIVGVNSSNKNIVVWNKPVSIGIDSFYVYRETNITNVFEKIGSVSYDSLSVFVDKQSNSDVKSYRYKLSVLDRSGLESPQSNSHKTMHLSINKGQNSTWNLIWEPYEGFTVSTYNIYRGTSTGNLNFMDATAGSSTQYSDISAPAGDVYYQMEVISPTIVNPSKAPGLKNTENNTYSMTSYSSSRSNIATNVISGLNELEGENYNINIYPNPVRDELKIDIAGGSTFEILNLTGQVVYNGNLKKSNIVQMTNLSVGVYLIKFKTGNTFEYKKIIKE